MRVISADFFVLVPPPEWLYLGSVGSVAKLFIHPENNEFSSTTNVRLGQRLHCDLGTYTCRVSHRHPYNQLIGYRIVDIGPIQIWVALSLLKTKLLQSFDRQFTPCR
jgi:hypothetical protein